MANFDLQADEVVLFEGTASCNLSKGRNKITLTSKKLIIEKEKGLLKKETELISNTDLTEVKMYNDEAQVKQKGAQVVIQAVENSIVLTFEGMLEARKFVSKMIGAVTGTTTAKRGSNMIKGAFDLIDDTLGLDSRETVKGFLENGVKGTLLNGLKKKE